MALARYTGGAVVVSGEVDLITDGTTVAKSHGAARSCPRSPAAVARRAACWPCTPVLPIRLRQHLVGTAVYNVAGTRAAAVADAPASFKVAFIDELYRATAQDIANNQLELEEA